MSKYDCLLCASAMDELNTFFNMVGPCAHQTTLKNHEMYIFMKVSIRASQKSIYCLFWANALQVVLSLVEKISRISEKLGGGVNSSAAHLLLGQKWMVSVLSRKVYTWTNQHK